MLTFCKRRLADIFVCILWANFSKKKLFRVGKNKMERNSFAIHFAFALNQSTQEKKQKNVCQRRKRQKKNKIAQFFFVVAILPKRKTNCATVVGVTN